jgi:hypothetical protein
MPVKITTTAALICGSLFFLTTLGQAEEHYIYKDPEGGLAISNQKSPAGSTILRKLDLPEFRETQMQQVQESSNRQVGKLTQTGTNEITSWLAVRSIRSLKELE